MAHLTNLVDAKLMVSIALAIVLAGVISSFLHWLASLVK